MNRGGQIVSGVPQSPRVPAIDVDKASVAHAGIGRIARSIDVRRQGAAIWFAVMLEGGILAQDIAARAPFDHFEAQVTLESRWKKRMGQANKGRNAKPTSKSNCICVPN